MLVLRRLVYPIFDSVTLKDIFSFSNMDNFTTEMDNITTESAIQTDIINTQNNTDIEHEGKEHYFAILGIVGVIANVLTLVVFSRNGGIFSSGILTLFKHQSIADITVCFIGIIIFLQQDMWTTGVYHLDLIICHVWHSQYFYWMFTAISGWNVVLISVERYIAIVWPLKHHTMPTHMCKSFIFIYILAAIVSSLMIIIVRFENGICVNALSNDSRKLMTYAQKTMIVLWSLIMYILPVMIFITLYGIILFTLRKRQHSSEFSNNTVITAANKTLIRTAILVTLCFIVFYGFDAWQALLYFLNIQMYLINTSFQKLTVLLALLNSCINPLIYACSMPLFRNVVR